VTDRPEAHQPSPSAPLAPRAGGPALDPYHRAALPRAQLAFTASQRRRLALLGLAIGLGCLLVAAVLGLLVVAVLFGA
jgi:hypothetical protein